MLIHNGMLCIIGGDQLTAARIRSAHTVRDNSERGCECLEGLQPAIEDWHTKGILLTVSY